MDIKEFNDAVTPCLHCDDELILDVRPFGSRQAEAVESYLQNRMTHLRSSGVGNTNRLVVLLCDAAVETPESTRMLLETLAASGELVEIRHGCSAKAFAMAG